MVWVFVTVSFQQILVVSEAEVGGRITGKLTRMLGQLPQKELNAILGFVFTFCFGNFKVLFYLRQIY